MAWFRSYILKAKFDGQSLDSKVSWLLFTKLCTAYNDLLISFAEVWKVEMSLASKYLSYEPFWELLLLTVVT